MGLKNDWEMNLCGSELHGRDTRWLGKGRSLEHWKRSKSEKSTEGVQRSAVKSCLDGQTDRPSRLNDTGRCCRLDPEKSTSTTEEAVKLTPDWHPDSL